MNKKIDISIYKNYLTWIIIAIMFLLCLFVFLFFGEINLSKLNWLVATNGKKWGEIIVDGKTSTGFGIYKGAPIVNGYIFLILFGILLISILLTMLLIFLKKIKFSSLAFVVSSFFVFFTIIISGLLYGDDNKFNWQIIVRIILVLVSYPVVFFPVNFIIKKIFINTIYGEEFISDLIRNEKENAKYINEINKYSNYKNKKESSVIEIESDQI